MKKSVERYMNEELLPRITTYSKPNQSQKTIIHLTNKSKTEELSSDELKVLELEVTAEYAAEQLYKKRQKANRARNEIEKKKKEEERKRLTREKIVIGGILLGAAENDSEMRQVVQKLSNSSRVAERDRDVIQGILQRLNITVPESNSEFKNMNELTEHYERDLAMNLQTHHAVSDDDTNSPW